MMNELEVIENFPNLDEVIRVMAEDIAKEIGVDPKKILRHDRPLKSYFRGNCPYCDTPLQISLIRDDLLECPDCKRWFSKIYYMNYPGCK